MILRGFEAATRGMQSLIDQNDSTANNVANVNTVGYKKQALAFQNVYDASVAQKDQNGDFKKIGELSMGSQVQKLTYDFSQGVLDKTSNVFDLAIQGDGFFKIQSSDGGGYSYTRNGSFTLNNNGVLVTKDGDSVLDYKSKPIKIKTDDVVMHSLNDIIINEDGQITISNDQTQMVLQKIGVFDFSNKEDIVCIGGSQFKPTNTSTNPELKAEKFSIEQGSLELSNANVVNEMMRTISTSRNYESLSKLVKTNGDSLTEVMRIARL